MEVAKYNHVATSNQINKAYKIITIINLQLIYTQRNEQGSPN
jgi:hypothetical protein